MTREQDTLLTQLILVLKHAYHDRFAPGAPHPLYLYPRRRPS